MKKLKEKNPVLMIEEDYRQLKRLVSKAAQKIRNSLAHELERAIILAKWAFPKHAIRLNSVVSVQDLHSKRVLQFTIVLPEHANPREEKLSVLSPMGTALIGFREAEELSWKFPTGYRRLRILKVSNAA